MNSVEEELLERLRAKPLIQSEEDLLLAALLGDDALREAVGGRPPDRQPTPVPSEARSERPPAGAYLRSITVTGFRGIGPARTLRIEPGPGLTVLCGRNGSGKSSFAEALEVLLTGRIKRFEDRPAVWQGTWRCLHAGTPEVSAEFTVEDTRGTTVVSRSWSPADKRIDGGTVRVQVPGEPAAGLHRLGWGEALDLYRPFLSHAELESLLARPSDLYDKLNALLGLDEIAEILDHLGGARREAEAVVNAARNQLPGLRELIDATGDERARLAGSILGQKDPDLDALEALATGSSVLPGDSALHVLGQLRALSAPGKEEVATLCELLEGAAERLERVGSSAAGDAAATADLLSAAVTHFERHGCCRPSWVIVCGHSG